MEKRYINKIIIVSIIDMSHATNVNEIVCCVQLIEWKLEHIGMNPTAETYLCLHRFGSVSTTSAHAAVN